MYLTRMVMLMINKKWFCGQNGMVDTIRFCLNNINKHNRAF